MFVIHHDRPHLPAPLIRRVARLRTIAPPFAHPIAHPRDFLRDDERHDQRQRNRRAERARPNSSGSDLPPRDPYGWGWARFFLTAKTVIPR